MARLNKAQQGVMLSLAEKRFAKIALAAKEKILADAKQALEDLSIEPDLSEIRTLEEQRRALEIRHKSERDKLTAKQNAEAEAMRVKLRTATDAKDGIVGANTADAQRTAFMVDMGAPRPRYQNSPHYLWPPDVSLSSIGYAITADNIVKKDDAEKIRQQVRDAWAKVESALNESMEAAQERVMLAMLDGDSGSDMLDKLIPSIEDLTR